MKKLRVAAVGLGWVALHVTCQSWSAAVTGVIDRSPGRARGEYRNDL